ncbi:MAG: hypothetical protein JRI44_11290, partial [Deltaproteobacteria bacterium]|nr:hypothetical protein [Deltaproteobacteria bacterium]
MGKRNFYFIFFPLVFLFIFVAFFGNHLFANGSTSTTTVYIPTTTSSTSSTTTTAPPEVKEFIAIGENQAILRKWKELARRLGFLNIHREGVNKGIVLTYRKAAPPTGLP